MRRSRSWSLLMGLSLVTILPASPAAAAGSGGWDPLGHGATANVSAITDKVYVLEAVGTKLYVGGQFENAGGIAAADRIAGWNGSAWSAVGAGIHDGTVYAIAVDRDRLRYAGGSFSNVGDANGDALAVWTGSAWHSVGGVAIQGPVFALDHRSHAVRGGGFGNVNNIAEADGVAAYGLDSNTWSAVTDGIFDIGGTPSDIEPDGAGGMYVSGNFTDVMASRRPTSSLATPAAPHGARWGRPEHRHKYGAIQSQPGRVWGLAVSGTDVYAVGEFINVYDGLTAIDAADKVAKWNGSSWSALGNSSFFGELGTATPYDVVVDGSRVIVVGAFLNAGGNPKADGIATFSGGSWSNVGTDAAGTNGPTSSLRDVAIVGSKLYVGGLSAAIGGGVRNDFVAFYRLRQPDATIATTGAAVGNDVYNATGASQAKSRSVPQGGRAASPSRSPMTAWGRTASSSRGRAAAPASRSSTWPAPPTSRPRSWRAPTPSAVWRQAPRAPSRSRSRSGARSPTVPPAPAGARHVDRRRRCQGRA